MADSTDMAIQAPIPIFSQIIGSGVGLGWGDKVDVHMSWGALSGTRGSGASRRCFGGVVAVYVHQGSNVPAIHADMKHIHAHTCKYMHVHTH